MQTQKGKKILFGAIVVAALMCLAGAVPAMQVSENSPGESGKITIEANHDPVIAAKGLQGNVQVTATEGPDMHPDLSMAHGTTVIAYNTQTSTFEAPVGVSYTEDGESWTQAFQFNSADFTSGSGLLRSPDIDYCSVIDSFYMTMIDPQAEQYNQEVAVIPGDIADAEDAVWWGISGTTSEGYKEGTQMVLDRWLVSLEIDDGFAPRNPGLLYVTYDTEEEAFLFPNEYESGWAAGFYYDGGSILDTSPAYYPEMSVGGDYMYMVMEHTNATTGNQEIAYKRTTTNLDPSSEPFLFLSGGGPGGMDKYADIEVWPQQMYLVSGEKQYEDPDVSASGNNVAVVYATNDNNYGDYDIHCAYSSDGGESWDTSVVAENHPADDTAPAVYTSGNSVYVAYISENNLYLAESEDGGATWNEPEQVNDEDGTVVAEPQAVCIDAGGIAWVDNRDGNNNIYYASLPAPNLVIESVTGGMGVTATIANTGSADAEGVDWTISLSGAVFLNSEVSGAIDTLAAGESTTISTGFVLGIGPTTISVEAGGVTGSASGFVLGPLVLGL